MAKHRTRLPFAMRATRLQVALLEDTGQREGGEPEVGASCCGSGIVPSLIRNQRRAFLRPSLERQDEGVALVFLAQLQPVLLVCSQREPQRIFPSPLLDGYAFTAARSIIALATFAARSCFAFDMRLAYFFDVASDL